MKKVVVLLILAVVILALLLALFLFGPKFGLRLFRTETVSQTSAHTVIKESLPIAEYSSLAYRYTTVVKDISAKELNGMKVPFTTRKYIFTYDGVMKLGIDCGDIAVEENSNDAGAVPVITLRLPPITILSHETIDDSIEVYDQSSTIFNKIKIDDAFRLTADRKREMEQKVMASAAVGDAKSSLEQQFGALFRGLPGIKDHYQIEFEWTPQPPLPSENP